MYGRSKEAAADRGLIDAQQLLILAQGMDNTEYGKHIRACAARKSAGQVEQGTVLRSTL